MRKSWGLARVLAHVDLVDSDDILRIPQRGRRQVARAAGVRVADISDWTWKLAVSHARRLRSA